MFLKNMISNKDDVERDDFKRKWLFKNIIWKEMLLMIYKKDHYLLIKKDAFNIGDAGPIHQIRICHYTVTLLLEIALGV